MKANVNRIRKMIKLITPGLSGEWAKKPKRKLPKEAEKLALVEKRGRIKIILEGIKELKKVVNDKKLAEELDVLEKEIKEKGWAALSEENRRILFRIKEIENRAVYSAENLPGELKKGKEHGVGVSDVGGKAVEVKGPKEGLTEKEQREIKRLAGEGKEKAILVKPTGVTYSYQGPDRRPVFRRASAHEIARHEETHLKYSVDSPAFNEAFAYLETYPSTALINYTKTSYEKMKYGKEPHELGWEIARECARLGISAEELYHAYKKSGSTELMKRIEQARKERNKKKARKMLLE